MPSQFIDVATSDGLCDAYLAYPDGSGPFPAVLFYMDGPGFRPTLHRMADRLASNGYVVLLPNLYYRRGRGLPWSFPDILKPENRPKVVEYVLSLTPELILKDASAFLGFLSSRPEVNTAAKVGLTGYCMGGGIAVRTAAQYPDRIGAAASFHGGRMTTDAPDSPHRLVGRISAELYFGHADNDEHMTAANIARLDDALVAAGVRFTSEVYTGAMHGYTMQDLPVYNAQAAERHWQNLLALFSRSLRPG
jgi:carboxymethylenebutenolidase